MSVTKTTASPALAAAGLLAFAASAAAAPADRTRGFFPVSVWYAGGKARAPMLETVTPASREAWKKDIAQIKRLGFNTVRTWIEWTACEKTEGRYDFSALQLLTDLAGEAGLRVIVQVYIDSAPDWVEARHPDSKFVSSNGVAVESQASPGFCFDHAGVQEKILDLFKAAAGAVKGKPAFYGWDLWSEPHIINWAEVYYVGDLQSVQFCYCHSTQARFREWLKKKYGTVEALNKAWYRTLRTWDEVEPPRFGTILTFTDYIDWKEFISDKLAEDLAAKAAAVRSVLPDSVVTSHSAGPGLFTRPDWSGTPDDRKMSDSVDFYGASIYPKHAWTIKPWSPFYRSSGLDFVRSMGLGNGGFYIGELQAGYGVFGMKMSYPVVGADLRDWMWSTVAYGARAVNIYAYYPMSTGYEAGGYGLVELDGKVTERAEAGGKVARVIAANQDLFLNALPARAEIAILYNPLSHMVGGQQAFTGEGQTVGVNNLSESLQGVHRAFFERNIPVDFLHVRDLGTPRAAGYKLVIAPYPVMMSQPHVAALVEYVRRRRDAPDRGPLRLGRREGRLEPGRPGRRPRRGSSAAARPCSRRSPRPASITITGGPRGLPAAQAGRQARHACSSRRASTSSDRRAGSWPSSRTDGRRSSRRRSARAGPSSSGPSSARPTITSRIPTTAKFFAGLAEWLEVRPGDRGAASSEPDVLVEGRVLEGDGYRLLFGFNRGEKSTTARFGVAAGAGRVRGRDLETGQAVAHPRGRAVRRRERPSNPPRSGSSFSGKTGTSIHA